MRKLELRLIKPSTEVVGEKTVEKIEIEVEEGRKVFLFTASSDVERRDAIELLEGLKKTIDPAKGVFLLLDPDAEFEVHEVA